MEDSGSRQLRQDVSDAWIRASRLLPELSEVTREIAARTGGVVDLTLQAELHLYFSPTFS